VLSEDFAKFFAMAVRRQRKAKKVSQEQLAERAELSSKMISLVERFERTPSVTVADLIAQGLNIPLSRLIKEAEDLRGRHNNRK